MNYQSAKQNLLNWFKIHRRELPWRTSWDEKRDPYRVLVSELMLQQTQVSVVLKYYEKWIQHFPTLDALSQASQSEVYAIWQGMGYYRRADFLRQIAQKIIQDFNGIFPCTRTEILSLPGVGEYTVGAILSLAFRQNAPILDGNLIRIFTRLHAWSGNPQESTLKTKLWEEAHRWADSKAPLLNEALMELGALCCTPKNPNCITCPLNDSCQAFVLEQTDLFPQNPKLNKIPWTGKMFWIIHNQQVLLIKNTHEPFGKNYWLPPYMGENQSLGLDIYEHQSLGVIKHAITKYNILMEQVLIQVEEIPTIFAQHEFQWLDINLIESTIHFNLALKGWKLYQKAIKTLPIE